MRKISTVLLIVGLALTIALGVNYYVNHHGNTIYQWKASLINYEKYELVGNSTLSGYVKADGEVSVYVLTKENFERLRKGEPFEYYRAWKRVRKVEFRDVKIPEGDYVLVVKNEEKGMQWISVKLVDKR
ncbi:hypothetical protein [Thermococcus sp.]